MDIHMSSTNTSDIHMASMWHGLRGEGGKRDLLWIWPVGEYPL